MIKGAYIMIQPVTQRKFVAQMGFVTDSDYPDPDKADRTEFYYTLEDAINANETRAKDTEHGFKVVHDPMGALSPTTHTEATLMKVYTAFMKMKIPRDQAIDIVNAIQAEGVLFRERQPDLGE